MRLWGLQRAQGQGRSDGREQQSMGQHAVRCYKPCLAATGSLRGCGPSSMDAGDDLTQGQTPRPLGLKGQPSTMSSNPQEEGKTEHVHGF